MALGQKDKPFVNEDENHLRTPRPDLLDRPYAPDYSGESFRNQYKVINKCNALVKSVTWQIIFTAKFGRSK